MLDSELWHQHAIYNRLQSLLMFVVMGGFLALLGWLLWGGDGIIWLLMLGMFLLLLNPIASPWMIMRMYRAVPLGSHQAPGLSQALKELARRADLSKMPSLYYIPSSMINAFTVGRRDEAAIAVTDGLLRSLDSREIIGVLAHEVSHIRSNDTWVMSVADLFSRLTNMLSLFGLFLLFINLPLLLLSYIGISWFAILILIFAPNLSAMAQLGLSRTREYDADLNAARLTGDPEGLARALVKIERSSGSLFERVFMPGRPVPEPSLLRTHPPTVERVHRLMSLERGKWDVLEPLRQRLGIASELDMGYSVRRSPRWHVTGLWH